MGDKRAAREGTIYSPQASTDFLHQPAVRGAIATPQGTLAKCLDTTGVSYHLQQQINQAQDTLILISL